MKTVLVAAGIAAVLSAPGLAQNAPAAAPSTCYIEVQRLMANPGGIGELGAAVRLLNERLRPEAEEVNRLKRLVDTLDQQQQQAMQNASSTSEDGSPAGTAPGDIAGVNGDLTRAAAQLAAKQAQLQADYTAQMSALVGPVQQRVGQRALAFGSQHGCANMKMARGPDVAALRSSGAHDMTLDFVSWYPKS